MDVPVKPAGYPLLRWRAGCAVRGMLRGGWAGSESVVVPVDRCRVRKVYGENCFRHNRSYMRPLEGDILASHQSPHIVAFYRGDSSGFTMERLGRPVGDAVGIMHVADPDALVRFLDAIGPELADQGLRHHDIHPGNILYDGQCRYKLVDFSWARNAGESYELPAEGVLNPYYSRDDGKAIDLLRYELEPLLRPKESFARRILAR